MRWSPKVHGGAAKRSAALAAGALALVLLLPQGAAAGPVAGRLYLTDDLLVAPAGAGGYGAKTFGMTDLPPAGSEARKAYLGTSMGAVTWTNAFEYAPPVPLLLEGPFTAKLLVSCETTAVYRPVVPGHLGNSAVSLLVAGSVVASAEREDQAAVCSGPADVKELEYALQVPRTAVDAGSVLGLHFHIYWSNTDDSVAQNGFLVTGVAGATSFLEGVGLPVDGAVAQMAPVAGGGAGTGNATGSPASPTTGAASPAGDGSAVDEKGSPGFEAVFAVAAIGALASLRRRTP